MRLALVEPSRPLAAAKSRKRLLTLVAGSVLLWAAGLKLWQSTHSHRVAGSSALADFGRTSLITWEIFLGLWLISGALPNAARRVAIGCFSVFACYTLYEALAGKADCGCFGQVHVNPWVTFILDVAIVLVLIFLAKPPVKPSRWSQRKWPVAAALGIGFSAGIVTTVLRPKMIETSSGLVIADSGKLVILEPHHWVGHRLPVLGNIVAQGSGKAMVNRLSVGQWIVMFYHASCDECRRMIPVYEALAQREAMSGKTPQVAFVRVPSDPPNPVPPGLFNSRLARHGTLDSSHEWFATTPIVVALRDGIVRRVAVGHSAMNPQWMNIRAHGYVTAGGIGAIQRVANIVQ